MKPLLELIGPSDHVLGPDDAPVTVVEYGSYDCHHCAGIPAIVDELRRRAKRPVRFVYRHFPQQTPHSRAELAAEAAEAAGAQGKFWEMHDLLLRHQEALDGFNMLVHAAALGLDTARFAAELDGSVYGVQVRRQFEGGRDSGVRSTPTFFINGVRHDGFWDVETLLAAIRRAPTAGEVEEGQPEKRPVAVGAAIIPLFTRAARDRI
jgi:protein-disulfide isomerase